MRVALSVDAQTVGQLGDDIIEVSSFEAGRGDLRADLGSLLCDIGEVKAALTCHA